MFTLDDFGVFIIDTMMWAAWIKTMAFAAIWYVLMRQDSSRPLGKWINRMFLTLMLTSVFVTLLTGYLGEVVSRPPNSGLEWVIIVGLNVFPVLSAGASVMVAYHSIKVEEVKVAAAAVVQKKQDERQERQDHTQEILDETSLDLTKRGHHYTRAGLNLDKRRSIMDAEQLDHDAREGELNIREGKDSV